MNDEFDNDIRKEYDRLPACRSGGEQAGTRNHFAAISPTGWQPVLLSCVVIKVWLEQSKAFGVIRLKAWPAK
jgi:hypothetical protein